MRLIDANELMEHVWRDRLDSREAIAEMLNNAPTVRNAIWVSVKDRLPDEDELVLVYTKDSVMSVCSLVVANAFANLKNLKVWEDNNGYYVSDVTHWMPLPQKPESEDDAE